MPRLFPRAAGMDSFTLAADSGASQAVSDGQTVTFAGDTGLTATIGGTRTITIDLDDTAVTPGAYTNASITVDQQGRITVAASGTAGANTALSNLAAVAVNISLISDAVNTDDLGSDALPWRTLYIGTSIVFDQTTRNLTLTASEPASSARTVNFGDPGANDSVVYLAATQLLTNKTYNGITATSGTNTFALSVGTASLDIAAGAFLNVDDDLTVEAASLINQDVTSDANVTFATVTVNNSGIHILDTNASHDLIFAAGSDLTADHTLTITTGDADRTLTLSANLTVEATSLVNQDLTTDATPTFAGVISSGAAGFDANPGSDIDTDILTIGVTGAPKMTWDESETEFDFTAGLDLPSGGNIRVANANAQRAYYIPASSMIPRTTTGPAVAQTESTTNAVNLIVLDFDENTDEFAQFYVPTPAYWEAGTITVTFYWTGALGSGDVVWGAQAVALRNDDAIDTAYGTAQIVTDTLIAANDVHITSATSAITVAGTLAAGNLLSVQVYRDANNVADTFDEDARLIAVKVTFGIDSYSDA